MIDKEILEKFKVYLSYCPGYGREEFTSLVLLVISEELKGIRKVLEDGVTTYVVDK